jgi:hypothetical protein
MIQTPRLPQSPSELSHTATTALPYHLMTNADVVFPPRGLGWELRTIELVEVPAPPRRNLGSVPPSSSSGDYDSTSYDGSEGGSDAEYEGGDDDIAELETASSSYCSSDDDEYDNTRQHDSRDPVTRRVLAWRASYSQSCCGCYRQPSQHGAL